MKTDKKETEKVTGVAGKEAITDVTEETAARTDDKAGSALGEGNSERKSAATVQAEQAEAGDVGERPGNEPMSSVADVTSRTGGTADLSQGSGNEPIHDPLLEDRVAALEADMARLKSQLKHWV